MKSFLDGASKQNKQIVICVYDGCHVAFVLPVKCLTYYTCDGYSTLLTFNQYSRHSISTALLARVTIFTFSINKISLKHSFMLILNPILIPMKQFSPNVCNIAVLCRLTSMSDFVTWSLEFPELCGFLQILYEWVCCYRRKESLGRKTWMRT